MYKTKQLISLILVLAMCLSLGTTAFATEISTAGSSAETPVILNVEAALFSVTIPTGLPVDVAASGTVTVATDAKIINNSHGPVQVVNMTIEAVEGWEIADYEIDLRNEKVDSNKISIIINELKTTGSNAIEFSTDNFTVMLAKNDDTTDECPIVYNAKVTPLSEAFATDTVANLVFTVDWYKAEGSASETTTSIPVVATDSDGNNLNATSTNIIGTEKEDLLAKLEESGLVTSADDVDALIEVETDDFDNIANATFDVSEIAQEGDKVVVLHFDETTQQWEYITEATVDADGKISADFTSFSPVAFVVVKEDGSTEIVAPEEPVDLNHSGTIPEGGTYTVAATSEVLEAGAEFPETVANTDVYAYGDYKYTYATLRNGWIVAINTDVTDKNQTTYGEILESINEQQVTWMDYTFYGCYSLVTAPTIPGGVTSMNYTFDYCTSLTTAPKIPSGVTSMTYTFRNCTNLKTYVGSTDADGDFSNYVIPSSVTDMNYTFQDCTALTTAPDMSNASSVTEMKGTFYRCKLLTHAPTIHSRVRDMYCTFWGCASLTTVPEIPSSVTNMTGTFQYCTSLIIAPAIPEYVTTMTETFNGCTSLTTASTIPSSVTEMGGTFEDCTALTGTIVINANPMNYTDCFYNVDFTAQNLTLTGDSTMLAELGATGTNYQG